MPPMQDHLYTGSEYGTAQGAVLDHTGQDVPRQYINYLAKGGSSPRGAGVSAACLRISTGQGAPHRTP